MATSNHERVGKALELLNQGLKPYIERELRGVYGNQWEARARDVLREDSMADSRSGVINWDTQALLVVLWEHWNTVFRNILGHAERSLVSELRDTRNRWAHQKAFSLDDSYRALDTIQRLLAAISAPEAIEIERQKQEILRLRFEDQARREQKKVATAPLGATPLPGLRSWRDIITPHPDVASGRYQQAEFAADLGQVHRGEGTDEYRNPRAFFERTFLTEGLRHLLTNAVERMTNRAGAGDPVVELQTNFGGGKTHSMLALYHLFSGTPPADLPGVDAMLAPLGVTHLPPVQRAVLVGQALSPGQPHKKPDGTVIHTLWGELAHQLLGRDGYQLVAAADRTGTSPGSDALRHLFDAAAPCLILIDEWVAYVRQLYTRADLPGGSFDANLTFAQALTEAARAVPHTLVVASLPSSDIEIGGEGGREALSRLRNTFGRLESAWRPASAEEGFEIVRRRLFQPITDPALFPARDAVVRTFMDLYRTQSSEFPAFCREVDYERRLTAAYPIHPELFDRLYTDWAALDKFQRTRGVLRLMAAVIHCLWERQDHSLLILPASIPIDDPAVQFELTRYMDDPWVPVIEKDVDGPHSLPLRLDREHPNLGRYSAARRVTRTIYLGSAPTLRTANQGLEDRHIKLGCAQPGESVATFGDVLRRLADQATHLYQNGQRFWFSTQPSVNRLAQDRAEQMSSDDIHQELLTRLQAILRQRGDFAGVHLNPRSSGEVPDERETRLVALGPDYPHSARNAASPARQEAQTILDQRGSSPRHYRNALVFLAPDTTRLQDLFQAVRQYRAWKSIEDEKDALNLDAFQAGQAKTRRTQAEEAIDQRIPETYIWLLVPTQPDPHGPLVWEELKVQGPDTLAVRAARRLRNDGLLLTQFAGTLLRMELDRIPLWQSDHVGVKLLADYFAQYLYLPRLQSPDVLLGAIEQGVAHLTWEHETFAYAERYDPERQRYLGLRAGQSGRIALDEAGVVVKPVAARQQLDADAAARQQREQPGIPPLPATPSSPSGPAAPAPGLREPAPHPGASLPVPPAPQPRRFHGTVTLDTTRMGRDAGQIAEAIVQHLASLVGARVRITLELEADLPDGVPDHTVRTVLENCRTLKFSQFGFEEE